MHAVEQRRQENQRQKPGALIANVPDKRSCLGALLEKNNTRQNRKYNYQYNYYSFHVIYGTTTAFISSSSVSPEDSFRKINLSIGPTPAGP